MKSIHEHAPQRYLVLIVSAGNRLLGDDGVGHMVLDRLRTRSLWGEQVGFHALEGDLFELAEWVDKTDHLIMLDAVAGKPIGQIDRVACRARVHPPSFHQTDVVTVLQQLETLHPSGEFPQWEVWGIRIPLPTEFCDELSEPVARAAEHLEGVVAARVQELVTEALRAEDGGEDEVRRGTHE